MDILKIKQFLSGNGNGYEDDYGFGNGSGFGNGFGFSNGNGDSDGFGNGFGNGNGDGYGGSYSNGFSDGYINGRGIKSINGYDVYKVDGIPTIFTHIHGNVAKGYILVKNVILKPCYIVKGNGYFAHSETLKEAQSELEEKIIDDMDIEEKIELFKEKFPDVNKKYTVKDFYQWHHNLTGSCEMGRKSFANSHNINFDNDMMTVKGFIKLTENAYRGEIIKELKESYENEKRNTI